MQYWATIPTILQMKCLLQSLSREFALTIAGRQAGGSHYTAVDGIVHIRGEPRHVELGERDGHRCHIVFDHASDRPLHSVRHEIRPIDGGDRNLFALDGAALWIVCCASLLILSDIPDINRMWSCSA